MQEAKEKIGMYMEPKQKSFEEKLAFGKEGEHEVGEYFMRRGYSLLPLYQFSEDLAPKIYNDGGVIISPDIFVAGLKKAFWVEVKTKNRWIKYLGNLETGLNERHFNEYLRINRKTELPVYVVFNHKEDMPNGFYFVEITTPFQRIWDGINRANGKRISPPLVLWRIEMLTKIL